MKPMQKVMLVSLWGMMVLVMVTAIGAQWYRASGWPV